MNEINAKLYPNGHLNIQDGNGIVQTYLVSSQSCFWREYNGQRAVKSIKCTITEFYKRIKDTYSGSEDK